MVTIRQQSRVTVAEYCEGENYPRVSVNGKESGNTLDKKGQQIKIGKYRAKSIITTKSVLLLIGKQQRKPLKWFCYPVNP